MANEITVLDSDGHGNYNLLMLFPIAAPKQINAVNVVPTPSSGLPVLALAILSAPEIAALNAGTSGWRVVNLQAGPNTTPSQFAVEAKRVYAAQAQDLSALYTAIYQFAGTRINYP